MNVMNARWTPHNIGAIIRRVPLRALRLARGAHFRGSYDAPALVPAFARIGRRRDAIADSRFLDPCGCQAAVSNARRAEGLRHAPRRGPDVPPAEPLPFLQQGRALRRVA